MSLYYTHLLIPTSPTYLPERDQVARFVQKLIEMGALDEPHRLGLANHDTPSRVRRGVNPATGEMIECASPTRTQLQAPADLIAAAHSLRNFDLEGAWGRVGSLCCRPSVDTRRENGGRGESPTM